MEAAFEDFLGERVFEGPFNSAAHWARAVLRIVALADEEVFGFLIELQDDVSGFEPVYHLADLEVQNLDEIRLDERAEHNEIVETVEEFGAESLPGFFKNAVAHFFVAALVGNGRKAER